MINTQYISTFITYFLSPPFSPWPRWGGTVTTLLSPTHMPLRPSSSPSITLSEPSTVSCRFWLSCLSQRSSQQIKNIDIIYIDLKWGVWGGLTRWRAACRPPACSCSGSGQGRGPRWSRCTSRAGVRPGRPPCRWGCGSRWRGCRTPARPRAGWHHLDGNAQKRQRSEVFSFKCKLNVMRLNHDNSVSGLIIRHTANYFVLTKIKKRLFILFEELTSKCST